MTRAALIAAACALAACAAPASAQAPTRTPGELVVGLAMPATGFQVGAVRGRDVVYAKGLEIDLALALAQQLGIANVRFVDEPRFPRLVDATPDDWDLALAQVTITAARRERVDFSRPYFTADQGVLLRRGLSVRSRSLAALRGLKLCAERGSTGADVLRGTIRPTRKPRYVGDLSRLEADLYQRRCDALVADAPQLGALRVQAPRRVGTLAGRIRTRERYGIVFERGSALRAPVNTALRALERDGTVDRLARKWLAGDTAELPVLK